MSDDDTVFGQALPMLPAHQQLVAAVAALGIEAEKALARAAEAETEAAALRQARDGEKRRADGAEVEAQTWRERCTQGGAGVDWRKMCEEGERDNERLRLALQDAEHRVKNLEAAAAEWEAKVRDGYGVQRDLRRHIADLEQATESPGIRLGDCAPAVCVTPGKCSRALRPEDRCWVCRASSGVRSEAVGRDGW